MKIKKPKVNLFRYSGGDLHDQLYKIKHYFHVYQVPRDERLDVACFFFEGKTSKWWRWLKFQFDQDGKRLGWSAFEEAFMEQWRPLPVMNHLGQLAKLKQDGKVVDYIEEF